MQEEMGHFSALRVLVRSASSTEFADNCPTLGLNPTCSPFVVDELHGLRCMDRAAVQATLLNGAARRRQTTRQQLQEQGRQRRRPPKQTNLRHDNEPLDGLLELGDGRAHSREEPVELHHLLLQHDRQRWQQPVLLHQRRQAIPTAISLDYACWFAGARVNGTKGGLLCWRWGGTTFQAHPIQVLRGGEGTKRD